MDQGAHIDQQEGIKAAYEARYSQNLGNIAQDVGMAIAEGDFLGVVFLTEALELLLLKAAELLREKAREVPPSPLN
ncbi:MAG: hypothetical protein B6I22_14615 [Desulfobacteraceae bacterium 4572_123]|nr:MAG: hypothetical protein B6I22_14615 [Desulfobacteraceae bacterium 4572_123]